MNQNERVAKYMEDFGSITTLEAFRDLGVTRLSARIHDIEASGRTIDRESIKVKTRYGDTAIVTKYKFKKVGNEQG